MQGAEEQRAGSQFKALNWEKRARINPGSERGACANRPTQRALGARADMDCGCYSQDVSWAAAASAAPQPRPTAQNSAAEKKFRGRTRLAISIIE